MVREECIVLAREHQSRYCFPKHILGTLQLSQWFQWINSGSWTDPSSCTQQVGYWKKGQSCDWQICWTWFASTWCSLPGLWSLTCIIATLFNYKVCCTWLKIHVQEVPDGRKESPGGPWQFIGLLPLFDPPRHDSAETIRRALHLGVNVKMITGLSYSSLSTLSWFL